MSEGKTPDAARTSPSWMQGRVGDWSRIRWPILIPLTLSFAGVFAILGALLLYPIGVLLAVIWGIDRAAPMKDQPHGMALLVTLIGAFVGVMLLSAVIWRAAVVTWLVRRRGWSRNDADAAIVQRRFPSAWLEP